MEKLRSQILNTKQSPSPQNFETFLPWACHILGIEINIMTNRTQQKQYVSAVNSERSQQLKNRRRSTISTDTSSIMSEIISQRDKSGKVASPTFYQPQANPSYDTVKINTVYDNCDNLVQLNFYNNTEIPRAVLKIIGLFIKFHVYLSNITINHGLNMATIYELNKLLSMSNITDLCLDNTNVIDANYDIILDEENHIRYLSLARCRIKDDIVHRFSLKLLFPLPASNTLSVLNLASNNITDLGAKYLAEALRTNRHLAYLNLSDNSISDEGAMAILDVLDEFLLTDEEVISSKSRYMEYLKEKNKQIFEVIVNLRAENYEKKVVKMKSALSSTTSNSSENIKKNKDPEAVRKRVDIRENPRTSRSMSVSGKSSSRKNEFLEKTSLWKNLEYQATKDLMYTKAKCIVEEKMSEFIHPFSPKELISENGKLYCYGNNGLAYLNIAYNNISYFTVKRLLSVLRHQKMYDRKPRGLLNITIEGNCIPTACTEYRQIENYLGIGNIGISPKRRQSVARKRSSIR